MRPFEQTTVKGVAARRAGGRARARDILAAFIGEGPAVRPSLLDSRARVGAHAACVLRDLALAMSELACGVRPKAIVRLYDDAWELAIERLGPTAQMSIYRTGADPQVALLDRAVAFAEVVESIRESILGAARASFSDAIEHDLEMARRALDGIDLEQVARSLPLGETTPALVELDRDAPMAFACEFAMRPGPREVDDLATERTDLHALLFRGRVRAEIRGRAIDLQDAHPFLFAERLTERARLALEAWEQGSALNLRSDAGGILLGLRVGTDGVLAVTLGGRAALVHGPATEGASGNRAIYTFPALSVTDFVEAALSFGRGLVRAILRRDRSQCKNLRLSAFRRQLREAGDLLREACQVDAKINPTPEPYRAFANSTRASKPAPTGIAHRVPSRLRYTARWRALVPGIDLRSTFLCGDRLVVGGASETFCLQRGSGEVLWRVATERATAVATPAGIARLHADGAMALHCLGTGEVTLRAWLAPRLGGPPSGAVVHVQGLPKLLIVTEGERHLVAVDLSSGEARWRYAWSPSFKGQGRRGSPRMKRAGKLLYFTSGDSALTALDVLTGSVVWRVRDRLRFRSSPLLDHDTLFAVSGGMGSATRLLAVDPFSGQSRWSAQAPGSSCTVEGGPLAAGGSVVLALRERAGLRLAAWDAISGELRWVSRSTVAPVGTSWLGVDDLLIGNTPTGELLAIDVANGDVRYRHTLGSFLEADTPRRLEPVLRSGALFVPHTDVHVFRPHDGAPLGRVGPCDAIPDLLRVDERCDVYVAEESGHLVSFTAGPRLSLVT